MPSWWHGIAHRFDVTELDEDDKKIALELAQAEMDRCNQESDVALQRAAQYARIIVSSGGGLPSPEARSGRGAR